MRGSSTSSKLEWSKKKRNNRSHSSSSSSTISTSPSSIIDSEFVSEELSLYQTSPNYNNNNPRSFPHSVKQKCWEKAEKVKGRDPDRWRRDVLGNTLFRKLVGCPGCLCHDYDHIVPFSKGGQSTLENCQVLQKNRGVAPKSLNLVQAFGRGKGPIEYIERSFYTCLKQMSPTSITYKATVNRSKGNRTEISKADLIQKSSYCRVSGRDMDLLELSAYGNVRRGQDEGGCRIQ